MGEEPAGGSSAGFTAGRTAQAAALAFPPPLFQRILQTAAGGALMLRSLSPRLFSNCCLLASASLRNRSPCLVLLLNQAER